MSSESLKKRPIISEELKVWGTLGGLICLGVGANVILHQSNTNRAIERASYLIKECAPGVANEPIGDVGSGNSHYVSSALRVGELINNQSDFDIVIPRLSVDELARAAHVLKARLEGESFGGSSALLEGVNKELAKACASERSSNTD